MIYIYIYTCTHVIWYIHTYERPKTRVYRLMIPLEPGRKADTLGCYMVYTRIASSFESKYYLMDFNVPFCHVFWCFDDFWTHCHVKNRLEDFPKIAWFNSPVVHPSTPCCNHPKSGDPPHTVYTYTVYHTPIYSHPQKEIEQLSAHPK